MIHTIKKLNEEIKTLARTGKEVGGISDTYHTFDELYAHRVALFIALCNIMYLTNPYADKIPWKSKLHHDGTMFSGGWFIAGIGTKKGQQITYHLPLKDWDKLRVVAYDKAPAEFDGHKPEDVIERLLEL